MQNGGAQTVEALIDGISQADGNLTETVAVLWTWLELNQRKLGSLRDKWSLIIDSAIGAEPFTGISDPLLKWLAEDPLRNAAELLARIEQGVGEPDWSDVDYARGVDGSEVMVAWRLSLLVKSLGGAARPQDSIEYPTPAALAPSLLVCPLDVHQIKLELVEPEDEDEDSWEQLVRKLAVSMSREGDGPSSFQVHLDTLGDHGMSGLRLDDQRRTGRFAPGDITTADEDACEAAARTAVAAAAGQGTVLVMPELAATPKVCEAISAQLRDEEDPPLLTVVGLYHEKLEQAPPPDLAAGKTGWSEYVNEAVVFGPDGEEIWRHRKLTCASAKVRQRESTFYAVEDTYLGDRLRLVPTPLGVVAVVICLDTFAAHARERIAKSPANVLFVPSLSRKTHRHRVSLQQLVKPLWGVAFVCNRWVDPGSWNEEPCRSFWAVDHRTVEVPDAKDPLDHPSFVFEAAKHTVEKVER
jgi:hypothetical protein